MGEIRCLLCNEIIKIPDYCHEKYDGEVTCEKCGGRLHIPLDDNKVRKYKVVSEPKVYTYDDYILKLHREEHEQRFKSDEPWYIAQLDDRLPVS